LGPGTFVLPDQLVDRTSGRAQTFYDTGAVHVNFADPYCPTGRAVVRKVAHEKGMDLTDGGHDGRHRGPRLLHPRRVPLVRDPGRHDREHDRPSRAVLARELGLCYTAIALVTDPRRRGRG
jgi:5'-methylthioadenosine phosphorylase